MTARTDRTIRRSVRYIGRTVGHILRLRNTGASGGVGDSLDEAKAAFRAAWERGP